MGLEELKKELTEDSGSTQESLFALLDVIANKGYVSVSDVNSLLKDQDLSMPGPEIFVWSINDLKEIYECTEEEADNVMDALSNDDWANDQVWFAMTDIAEDKGLIKRIHND